MLVHNVPSRRESIPATAPITRVSLDDLLGSAHAEEREALLALLRQSGKVHARVVQTQADGVSVLDFGKLRAAVRLTGAHAAGELLLVVIEEAQAHTPAPAATVTLSRPAALLTQLRNNQINQLLTEIPEATPLVASGDSPTTLARALQQTLRDSGLFYESHLQGWLEGRVALEALRQEPQARLMTTAESSRGASETLPQRLEHLVRQQLDVLARGAVEWRGLVWPDQPAAIAIQAEPHPPGSEAATQTWRIHLDLDLPALGAVAVDAALTGRALDVRLHGNPAAAAKLRQASTTLAATLAAQNLAVGPILVQGIANDE